MDRGEHLAGLPARLSEALAGRYEIESEVGRGGMAVVFLAHDLKHDRRVALKVLLPDLSSSVGGERFLREIRTVARLEHPNILSLYDSGEAGGLLFYAMPFVEGESLGGRLKREGALPVDEAIKITSEIAKALEYAHEQGVVHRDIKPDNILFMRGHALVADFGIAHAVTEAGGERLTRTGIVTGTPVYMSPEQATASEKLDGRSDQYSLACVLYEMLTGEPPLSGRSAQSIIARRMSETATPPTVLRPSTPAGLERAVLKALERVPADRYRDMAEFRKALTAEAPASAATAATPLPESRRVFRNARTTGIAVIALVAIGWLGWRIFRPDGSGPENAAAATLPGIAVLPFGFIGPDSADRWVADGAAMKLANAFLRTGVPSPGWPAVKRFKDSTPDAAVLGAELKVGYVLQGDVLYRGDSMELSVQLTRTNDQAVVWQQTFTGLTSALTDFEAQIAQVAVDSVAQHAGLSPGRLVVKRYTEDSLADSLYTRALYMYNEFYDPDSTRVIIELSQQAIERDSTFAPAYVLLAGGLSQMSRVFWAVPPREQAPRIRELLERAIEIDPDLVEAKSFYGWYYYVYAWEWEAAESLLEQAISLDPRAAQAREMLAFPLVATGKTDSAIASTRAASALEPFNPLHVSTECWILYLAHRYEEAIDRCQFVVDSIDASHPAAVGIGETSRFMLEFVEGEPSATQVQEKAEEILSTLAPLEKRPLNFEIGAALQLAQLGLADTARAIIEEEIGRPGFRPLRAANVYAAIGDMDEAWSWLERAYEARDPNLAESAVRPEMAPFRADPRWPEFARRMNLD